MEGSKVEAGEPAARNSAQQSSAQTDKCKVADDDEEYSAGEENNTAVMRTEITVAIKDSAQPTVDEIKEFESFSSKNQPYRVIMHRFRTLS